MNNLNYPDPIENPSFTLSEEERAFNQIPSDFFPLYPTEQDSIFNKNFIGDQSTSFQGPLSTNESTQEKTNMSIKNYTLYNTQESQKYKNIVELFNVIQKNEDQVKETYNLIEKLYLDLKAKEEEA